MPKLLRPARSALVGFTATALVAAGLVVTVGPAHAASTTRLLLTPSNQTVAAGTCALFTVTPLDNDGRQATDTPTITIRSTENPQNETQDVDFCEIPGTTTTPLGDGAFYYNGVVNDEPTAQNPTQPGAARFKQDYDPGTGITPDINGNHPGGDPDSADNTDEQPNDGIFLSDYNTNPSGQDYAQFRVPQGGQVKFGLVGLRPGGADILAYIETGTVGDAFPPTRSGSEATFTTGQLTFTNGGAAGSQQAADAVTLLDAEPEDDAAPVGTAQFFTATLTNNTGQTVAGVTPQVRVVGGPNVAPGDQVRSDCGPSNNNGVSTCAFQGRKAGVDTLTIFVNRTSGTAGPDGTEAQDTITRTTTGPTNTNPAQARFVDLVPDAATTTAGQSREFTAIVTDASGSPVQGVTVGFSETGPGVFSNGQSTQSATTGNTGRAVVTVLTTAGQTGTQTLAATLAAASTDCDQPLGTPPGAAAGRCTDSATHTISTAASPSPTASTTPSATPTATISPSSSPTATPGQCSTTPTISLQPTTINATGSGGVTVSGPAGRQIELFAYSQPSTTYRVVRTGTLDSNGNISFTVRPPTNTRLYAQIVGCDTDDVRFSRVLNVRTTLSLFVVRNGKQDYTFSGDSLPARPGGLIVSLYRFNEAGGQVLTAQARARTDNGDWVIRRVFTGTGRFDFQVRTGQDLQNAPGQSNIRSLLVF